MEPKETIRAILQEHYNAVFPRAAIVDMTGLAPRIVSAALQALKREGVAETYLDEDDNRPIWTWCGELND